MAKRYVVSLGIMIVTALASLLIVSTLTYLLKWQADKAMVGIIVTYVLAGFFGGLSRNLLEKKQYSDEQKKGVGKKAVEALLLSNVFMLLLFSISVLVLQNQFEFSTRFLLIWVLFVSSTFLGRIL